MKSLLLGVLLAVAAQTAAADPLIRVLRPADIVFLGEVHDNPHHHRSQADLIEALAPAAVVFEMLTPAQAQQLHGATDTSAANLDRLLNWADSGWPDIAIYAPVFAAVRPAVPVGVANSSAQARAAFADGAAAAFGPGAAKFGLTAPLPARQLQKRMDLQFDAHCQAMPRAMMGGMVEAQRWRDAKIAQAALATFEAYGGPVIVITGNGHAQKNWGAAQMLTLARPDLRSVSVGHLEPGGDPQGFDVTLMFPAADRPDPCTAFK